MRDPFAGYDQWLERPYQDMIEESDRYFDWCEDNDLDPDDPASQDLFAEAVTDEYEYNDYDPDDDEWGPIDHMIINHPRDCWCYNQPDVPDWWE